MTLHVKNGKLLKPEEHLFNVCSEQGLYKAREVLYESYPSIATKRGGTIMKNLAEFSEYRIGTKVNGNTKRKYIFKADFLNLIGLN